MINQIFIDTDCISSFLWVDETNILEVLYPGRIVIPESVYRELSHPRVKQLRKKTDELISRGSACVCDIYVDSDEYKIYKSLTTNTDNQKLIGKGEAAAIALAVVRNGILASNNLSDTMPYIKKYDISYITTPDILVKAYEKGIIDEDKGNELWKNMVKRKRKLPGDSFSDYLVKHCKLLTHKKTVTHKIVHDRKSKETL